MKRVRRLAVVVTALVVGISGLGAASASAQVVNLDFTGQTEGLLVSGLSSGSGITGDAVPGSIQVFGDRAPVGEGTGNAAMVYDAACGGGGPANCSGGEDDKFKPMLGKVLTIADSHADRNGDGLADAPDTAGSGGLLSFDFSSFGAGRATVMSLDVLDAERGGWIKLFARGALVATVRFGPTLNNSLSTFPLGHSGIDRMEVMLQDSGVIDNIRLAFGAGTPPPQAACGSLRLSVRSLARARRGVVLATVRDKRGVAMAGVRVVARGAGVRSSRITNARGLVRFLVRPRRAGVVRFAVPAAGSRCARQVVVRSVSPPLAG